MTKQTQWSTFLRKNKLDAVSLVEALELIRGLLLPVLSVPVDGQIANKEWSGGSWS